MSVTGASSLKDVALTVGDALRRHGIRAVLTGGACATIYSDGHYLSTDVDFILQSRAQQSDLDRAMADVGFRREGPCYVHARSPFWVEFPRGPLAIGSDYNVRPVKLRGRLGSSLALSPTDACRDRLAAFYHWGDRQSLVVAALIASRRRVDLDVIRDWSQREGHADRFQEFLDEIPGRTPARAGRHRRRRVR